MRSTAALGLLALIPLFPFPQQSGDDEIPPWDFGAGAANAALDLEMQGAWTLTALNHRVETFASTRGYLLISEGFMSLEFHGRVAGRDAAELLFQSGVHSYELTQFSRLRTTSLIGVNNLSDPIYSAFEEPGRLREFFITCQGNTLSLRRTDDGTELKFKRMHHPRGDKRDFYGRGVEEPAVGGER